jgi:HK97 gp10 family phage protein
VGYSDKASVTIALLGEREFQRQMQAAQRIATDPVNLQDGLTPGANWILERARQLCPVSHFGSHNLPPGALRDSLTISSHPGEHGKAYVSIDTPFGNLESGNPVAAYVEYGTKYSAAQPFMRPAFDEYQYFVAPNLFAMLFSLIKIKTGLDWT